MDFEMLEDQDYTKILDLISTCQSTAKLNNFIKNAERKNVAVVRDAAIRQLASLIPDYKPGTLEYDFWKVLRTYELVLKEGGKDHVRLYKTREKVESQGVEKTLSDWTNLQLHQTVFETLLKRNMGDLTAESIIFKYSNKFDQEIVDAAQGRLDAFDYD